MPPHQFCKAGAAKAERLNDSFPSCSCCQAPQPSKPSHRHVPAPVRGALVCATERGCALGTIPGKSHTELPHCCCGIPAPSLWAVQEPENTTLQVLSVLCLWVSGTSGTSLSSSGLPSFTSSELCCHLSLCPPWDTWIVKTSPSLLSLATCLVEQKGRIPVRHLFFYGNSGQTPAFYQCWISFGWKVKRAALPKHKTTQPTSFGCLMNSFT